MVEVLVNDDICETGDSVSFLESLDFWANGLDGAREIAAEDVGILVDEGGVVLDFPVDGIGSNGAILD